MLNPKVSNDAKITEKGKAIQIDHVGNDIERKKKGKASSSSSGDDQTPREPLLTCEICVDEFPKREFLSPMGCTHSYCFECVTAYVVSRIQQNNPRVTCPVLGCEGLLEPDQCRSILPPGVFDRWGIALCEQGIPPSQRFYCPHKDCSVLMIDDCGDTGEVIKQMECRHCNRMVCVQCRAPWHSGIECSEFQKNNEMRKEDVMVMDLAIENMWQRCPSCKIYVQKISGCNTMQCRCGCYFCYACGDQFIPKCKCTVRESPDGPTMLPPPQLPLLEFFYPWTPPVVSNMDGSGLILLPRQRGPPVELNSSISNTNGSGVVRLHRPWLRSVETDRSAHRNLSPNRHRNLSTWRRS